MAAQQAYKAKVASHKKKTVDEFTGLLKEYPIVGAVNMENLPARTLQKMREQLRGTVVLKMTKRRFINRALESAKKDKPDIGKLQEYLRGMPALLFTKDNPFALYKILKKNKSKAPAKSGQVAPKDIIVPAGPTSFAPGPVIGELGQLGIKAGIDAGKVAIKQDTTVCKEGQVISSQLAAMLTRLGIEPMEIGLDLVAAYEDGMIYTRSVLDIDENAYKDNIATGARWAFNLAMEAGVLTKETTNMLITKAARDSRGLAIEAGILAKGVTEDVLAKAHRQMLAVKSAAKIEYD